MKCQTTKVFLAAGLLGMSGLAGCGGSSGSETTALIIPQSRSVSAATASGLTASLSEDTDAIRQGGSVNYTIALTNPTSQTITLQISPGCGNVDPLSPDAALTVIDSTGATVYPEALGVPCAPVTGPAVTQTLTPGQTLAAKIMVSKTLGSPEIFGAKGIYTASVRILTSQSSSEATLIGPLTLTVQ